MAVAIKATATISYYSAIKGFAKRRRRGIETACPFCGQPYLVYFGPEMDEREARHWFYYQSRQDHPHSGDGFAAREDFPALEELAS